MQGAFVKHVELVAGRICISVLMLIYEPQIVVVSWCCLLVFHWIHCIGEVARDPLDIW